jgi:hypothetical protein
MTLFGTIKAHTHIVEFAKLALQAHAQQRPEPRLPNKEPDKKAQVGRAPGPQLYRFTDMLVLRMNM